MSFDFSSWIVPAIVTLLALVIGRIAAVRAAHGGRDYGLRVLSVLGYGAAIVAWFLFLLLNFV